ncbi:hypothetical protein CWI38_0035p0030 [Hamiltosporidium tvaerminnensis]|uniref:Uncharacterized protein n=1 Tax=Hamiltosporidium tvaerminnensis TaxID=1176355 RepID=A0A4Q9M1S5_9MICR|nr:hypothetical protein CWI38_0035p0030 [Hamiltosporidium tvaerminnensis]
MNVGAYIQSIVLKKTVETISFDRRRGLEASMGVIMRAEMHEEPTPPLKEEKREEDGAKNFKPKNKAPFISQRGTTLEEPTNNINKESDLEEEPKVVKEIIAGFDGNKTTLYLQLFYGCCYEEERLIIIFELWSMRSVSKKIKYIRLGSKEFLLLHRIELDSGLTCVIFCSEHVLLQLLNSHEKSKDTSTRREAILRYLITNFTLFN